MHPPNPPATMLNLQCYFYIILYTNVKNLFIKKAHEKIMGKLYYINMTKDESQQIGKQGEIIYLKLNGANP